MIMSYDENGDVSTFFRIFDVFYIFSHSARISVLDSSLPTAGPGNGESTLDFLKSKAKFEMGNNT